MSYRRDLEKLAAAFGRMIEHTKGTHLRLYARGRQPIIAPLTPRNAHTSLKQTRALLKRYDRQPKPRRK